MAEKPLANVLVKPAGADCNLACTYCFYRAKEAAPRRTENSRMSVQVLEEMIRQILSGPEKEISIGWQGGEPTLMGLPFFYKAVEFQERYGRGKIIGNGLQTNGLLLDKKWFKLFTDYGFLVGLSLDGPEHIHDRYRRFAGGKGSWAQVGDQAKRMLDEGVAVNALAVVTDYSSLYPEEIYGFLKGLGFTYMQFIPCVETDPDNPQRAAFFSASPAEYGNFLCRVFDLWLADFSGGRPTTSIRFFESLLYLYAGFPAPECTLLAECGSYGVMEHNGDFYSCDFFVEPRWKLGNILSEPMTSLLNSPRQTEFGKRKAELPGACGDCPWKAKCRGGCVKDRIRDPRDKNLNHFCESFKMFFTHADPYLCRLAAQGKVAREALARVEPPEGIKTGRNEPCPCGSGRKYKKCCSR
jgi:uncharacterized protein